MKQDRRHNDLIRAILLVREGEERVAIQKERIAFLMSKGLPTAEAKATLVVFERSLSEMRNHLAVLRELMDLGPESK
jgi:hypothetical protein